VREVLREEFPETTDEIRSRGPHRYDNPYVGSYDLTDYTPQPNPRKWMLNAAKHRKIEDAHWGGMYKTRQYIIDQLDKRSITLILDAGRPKLLIDPPFKYSFNYPRDVTAISVFSTSNSKMTCISFALPAAAPSFGGTCQAQALQNKDSVPETFICKFCYAGKGNIMMENAQLGQLTRFAWVDIMLNSDEFVNVMSDCLDTMLQHIPKKLRTLGANFVRIHDSGDFYSLKYLEGWKRVAENFKGQLLFWSPTRQWVFENFAEAMRDVPSNFTIRPSALHIGDAPPQGFASPGSTVNVKEGNPAGSFVGWVGSEKPVWICPAYREENKAASCLSTHCRKCWGFAHPVSYTAH
jgi:hypothetical protein